MAYCIYCGEELIPNSKFCTNCGASVVTNETEEIINNEKIQHDSSKRNVEFNGTLYKCPNCGNVMNSFAPNCSACGYELRSVQKTSIVNELSIKLQKAKTREEKEDLISNFYVPNTKEDILEFFILANAHIKSDNEQIEAWGVKLEQAYQKAELTFGGTEEFEYIKKTYNETKTKKKINVMSRFLSKKTGLALVMFIIALLLIIIGGLVVDEMPSFKVLIIVGGILVYASAMIAIIGSSSDKESKKNKNK